MAVYVLGDVFDDIAHGPAFGRIHYLPVKARGDVAIRPLAHRMVLALKVALVMAQGVALQGAYQLTLLGGIDEQQQVPVGGAIVMGFDHPKAEILDTTAGKGCAAALPEGAEIGVGVAGSVAKILGVFSGAGGLAMSLGGCLPRVILARGCPGEEQAHIAHFVRCIGEAPRLTPDSLQNAITFNPLRRDVEIG
ncbi:hypothetical protein A9R10_03010 [Aeromonas piscicola]|nr:hypothetical protein A9R10_03010 [Aeromonas piscicola]